MNDPGSLGGGCNLGFCALDTSATLLGTGKVIVAGGFVGRYPNEFTTVGATLYDPATNTWTSTGNMNQGRAEQTASLLPNGQVLVAGGQNLTGNLARLLRWRGTRLG